ncbi:MAG TPA: serine/threonine-protein kinase [Ktedonobacteraceae bacterium]
MLTNPQAFIGQTIGNRYTIKELIGQGGMGYVYLARDRMSGHACAVKMFLPQKTSERSADTYQRFLERFKREYNIVDAANHPHIIQVYSRGEYQGVAYFAMEYFPAGSLDARIEKYSQIPPREACLYIRQAAEALDYIHARGVIHRDIKPQNMLIDKLGNLILADFGVAHIAGSSLTLTDQPGTKIYKSPQAKLDLSPDTRDDIFSLGIVLYEMLTGNEPHLRHIHSMGPEVPAAIQPIILKATADRREDRYPSARAMARDLEKALSPRQRPNTLQTHQARGQPRGPSAVKKPLQRGKQGGNLFSFLRLAIVLLVACTLLGAFSLLQRATVHPSAVIFSFPASTAVSSTTTPSLTVTPNPPSASQQQAATAVVQQYYLDWNKQQYQAAYSLLQATYQQQYPLATLMPSYQHTHYACITITHTDPQADNSIQVQVTDNAVEDAATGGTVVSLYHIVYTVKQEQHSWKIAPLSLQRINTAGICNP